MSDLKERFRTLDRIPAPDLWTNIERREPADLSLGPSWGRIGVATLALVMAAAGVFVAVRAFVVGNGSRVVVSPPPVAKGNGEIAFVRGPRSAHPTIYVVRSDGKGLEKLASPGAGAFDPAWSPDGTRIAFVAGAPLNIYVMKADGSGIRRLSRCDPPPCEDNQPAWSPDGRRLAFVRFGDIYVMNADGSSVRRLTHAPTPLGDGQPAWSPDGTRIAFVVLREAPGNVPAIYLMNADGTGVRKLTRCVGEGCLDSQPSWSPDGKQIAFIRDRGIEIMTYNGAGAATLVQCSRIGSCVALSQPEWSPDGTRIAFTLARADSRSQLLTIQLDSGEITALLPAKLDVCCPSWQPIPK